MPTPRPRLLLLLAGALACGSSDLALPTDVPPARIEMVQGDDQRGPPGTALPDPLIVRVTDSTGSPLAGQAVTWTVNGGGGAIDPVTEASNAEGLVFAQWILGPEPGLNVVEAEVAGADAVTFTATAGAPGGEGNGGGVAAHLAAVDGDDQTARAGAAVPVRPAVRVTDSAGDPVPGVLVTFAVTAGGGSVEGATQTTNDGGIATVGRWTLGSEPGSNALEARAGAIEGSPVVFTAQATAAEPEPRVNRLIYRFPPPDFVKKHESFPVKVALVNAAGDVVPLDGILIYLGLFPEGSASPTNQAIEGSRFESTVAGIATFEIAVGRNGRYRLRALTDDLPELGPHGPEPWLYSKLFEVK
jgi:hypothetical protein